MVGNKQNDVNAVLDFYTIVKLLPSGEITMYEAEDIRDILQHIDEVERMQKETILKIYEKDTPIKHEYFSSLPDDLDGDWFISHIHYNGIMSGYLFNSPKEVREVLDKLIKQAQGPSQQFGYGEDYTLIFPPGAKTISLESLELMKAFYVV